MRGAVLPSACHAARPCRAPFAAGAPQWRCTHSRCSARPARRGGAPPTAILQGLASTINTIMDGRPQKANKVVKRLFELLEAANLGVANTPEQKAAVLACVDELAALGAGEEYTREPTLCGNWQLAYTTEKEILFILANAGVFKARVSGIYQVLDLRRQKSAAVYNTVIFAPREAKEGQDARQQLFGAFTVIGSLRTSGPQRLDFRFAEAMLKLGARSLWLPPFGRGWFDVVYMDTRLRVTRDSRGDTSVLLRVGDLQIEDGDVLLGGLY